MTQEIVNPFKQVKKTDWAKKAQQRLNTNNTETPKVEKSKPSKPKIENKQVKRVAKSFKIYPGKISKDFDKRVNKLQVVFDDLDYEKDYVDSGKYLMFLMAFAEKYGIYELYSSVNKDGEMDIDKNKLKEFIKKIS